MARSETFKLRLTPAELESYKYAAGAAGMDLSGWIRSRLGPANAILTASPEPPSPTTVFDSEKPRAKKARTGLCEHRRRVEEFCPRCD